MTLQNMINRYSPGSYPRFRKGQRIVCNTRTWHNVVSGRLDQDNDPAFNEIVTVKGYCKQRFNGYPVLVLEEYPLTPYVEASFEEYIEDRQLEKLLCGQKV